MGLTSNGEDIDAIELIEDGHLLISTRGGFGVPGVSGKDEDILEFTPSLLGGSTAGTWAMYFDGSDVGLGSSGEDVNAMALGSNGDIYFSTVGNLSANGLSGSDEDVFRFTPTSLGNTTAGSFDPTRFFDGSFHDVGGADVFGIDLP